MKYLIAGGTGFIGSHLLNHLSRDRHDIVLLTRGATRTASMHNATLRYVYWDPYKSGEWMKEIDGSDTVINLIGKNVFENRWNEKVKKEIFDSRVIPTRLIVQAIGAAVRKPALMISASAVGFYGDRQDETITEESAPGKDFLADVVKQWEGAAYEAEQYGVRVATPRIGLVLEKSGGMIGKMLLPFQLFAGGPIGSGKQYLPWVHMEDVVRGILYPVENKTFRGVYNLVSPSPITMNEFAKKFGAVLRRPSWLPVPSIALTILYGEGGAVILSGQRALPKRLLESGYVFSYTELPAALHNIVK
jgi:hypothetical protein